MTTKLSPREQAFNDVEWHLARVGWKLGGFWLGIWGRVRDARHHLEQAELALNALKEMEGTAEVERLQ